MTSDLRVIVAVAVLLALILLRLQAESFGSAEYDEPNNRYHRGAWTRLSWYGLGLILVYAIYEIHPQPHDMLYLEVGNHVDVFTFGLPLAAVGLVQAGLFAWYRYGYLRLPAARAYPGAAINSILTAVIDEAVFRGVLQGMLLAVGFPMGSAILTQTVVYVLATRVAAPGRHRYMLVLTIGIGIACGWATVSTGGIGAAILAHSLTSFAVFVCTGHAGQVTTGIEPEEEDQLRKPVGWRQVPRDDGQWPRLPGEDRARGSRIP